MSACSFVRGKIDMNKKSYDLKKFDSIFWSIFLYNKKCMDQAQTLNAFNLPW